LVADVIVSKLVDHLPLYRQEQRYARQGFPIARSTLCGWLAEAADVLTPLWNHLKARVLSAKIVHTDDTPIPVQDPERHCRTGRIWAYVSEHGRRWRWQFGAIAGHYNHAYRPRSLRRYRPGRRRRVVV
jgi:hypothetical protein